MAGFSPYHSIYKKQLDLGGGISLVYRWSLLLPNYISVTNCLETNIITFSTTQVFNKKQCVQNRETNSEDPTLHS
jgi:hypothetical protein